MSSSNRTLAARSNFLSLKKSWPSSAAAVGRSLGSGASVWASRSASTESAAATLSGTTRACVRMSCTTGASGAQAWSTQTPKEYTSEAAVAHSLCVFVRHGENHPLMLNKHVSPQLAHMCV